MAGQINIAGTSGSVQLFGNDTIVTDINIYFPPAGGLLFANGNALDATTGTFSGDVNVNSGSIELRANGNIRQEAPQAWHRVYRKTSTSSDPVAIYISDVGSTAKNQIVFTADGSITAAGGKFELSADGHINTFGEAGSGGSSQATICAPQTGNGGRNLLVMKTGATDFNTGTERFIVNDQGDVTASGSITAAGEIAYVNPSAGEKNDVISVYDSGDGTKTTQTFSVGSNGQIRTAGDAGAGQLILNAARYGSVTSYGGTSVYVPINAGQSAVIPVNDLLGNKGGLISIRCHSDGNAGASTTQLYSAMSKSSNGIEIQSLGSPVNGATSGFSFGAVGGGSGITLTNNGSGAMQWFISWGPMG